MAAAKFAENFYSFRNDASIFAVATVWSQDQAALAAIEAKIAEAHGAFHARRYRDAITAYKEAEALIYAQLEPGFSVQVVDEVTAFPKHPELFDSLFSLSTEWMNVLPVQEPVFAVQPRVPVKPELLGDAAKLEQTGLMGRAISGRGAAGAAADWKLSRLYSAQGNADASKFFLDRARGANPNVVTELEKTVARPGATGPGAVTGPGPVVGPGPIFTHQPGVGGVVMPAALPIAAEGLTLREALGPRPGFTATIGPSVVASPTLPSTLRQDRTFGLLVEGNVKNFTWNAGSAPPLADLKKAIYEQRKGLKLLPDLVLKPKQPADFALSLPHLYYYVIPLALGECYQAVGDYPAAETQYFQAAAYSYLNAAIEAPYVWLRLATLYLEWGNSLYVEEENNDALGIYQRVLTVTGTAPNSTLYTTVSLKPGADAARSVITNLANPAAAGANQEIAAVIMDVRKQLLKLQGGLDFWGHQSTSIPIWTFDYLQQVAINFTQLAISAERDVISFWERADLGELTKLQLQQGVAQTAAEAEAARLQADASAAEVQVYQDGVTLAQVRAQNAAAQATEYGNLSRSWIVHQAQSTQLSGGDDGNSRQLNRLADRMMSGPYSIEGDRGTLAAAEQLVSSRLQRQYELDSLNRTAQEMNVALGQAQSNLAAAQARSAASAAGAAAAELRASSAQDSLDAFNSQTFTPDVWYRMGQVMWGLYQRHLGMAVQTAKLMQRAYNFETDQSLRIIKSNYSTGVVKGLLGADTLMADIQSFTYQLITTQKSKPQPIRQTISLAERYPFAFERQFRPTGAMEFETRIDDFDLVYPGTYAGRIDAVEVSVEGIVPVRGISGSLTNSGISAYRLPSSLWTDPQTSGLKYRVQPKETLVLSDYAMRQDGLLVPEDQRMLRILQGAGLASSWRFELPKAINDIDYGALTDVKITFYYKARFDPQLKTRVLAALATRPALNGRQRGIPLRWIYPDAFFNFQDTGQLEITLEPADFRHNETAQKLTEIGVLIVTDGSIPQNGLKVSLTTPTHAAVTATTGAGGIIGSETGPWTALASGTALGRYVIGLSAADNPGLVHDGQLSLAPIVNMSLILGYTFTPRA